MDGAANAACCAAVQQQVAQALAALEQQRQLKLRLAQAPGVSPAERRLLEAEAAADLRAQGLLAHWGVQEACGARQAAVQPAGEWVRHAGLCARG